MARHNTKGRKDANHNEICAELEQAGFSVLDLSSVGDGCPDALIARGDKQLLVEFKSDKGKLTEDEIEMFRVWPLGLVIVARSTEDVMREWSLI